MLLTTHIIIALLSLVYTTYAYFSPSQVTLKGMYGFVGTTLLSGIALVASSPENLVPACTSGIIYIGVVSCGIVLVRKKLSIKL